MSTVAVTVRRRDFDKTLINVCEARLLLLINARWVARDVREASRLCTRLVRRHREGAVRMLIPVRNTALGSNLIRRLI